MQRVHLLLWFTCLHQKTSSSKCIRLHSHPSSLHAQPHSPPTFVSGTLTLITPHFAITLISHAQHLVSIIHIPPSPLPTLVLLATHIPNHTMTRGYPHHHYRPSQPPSHVPSSSARPRPTAHIYRTSHTLSIAATPPIAAAKAATNQEEPHSFLERV
jgi:hypothetical protein